MSDVTELKAAVAADVAAVKADAGKVATFVDKVKAVAAAAYKPFAVGLVVGFVARLILKHL